jgi:hypothetical protein
VDINRQRLIQFLADVDQEILNMRAGEGRWYHRALCFDKGPESSPVMHRLTVFKEYPTRKNLKEFFEISEQDFGKLTTDNFRTWGAAIFPETAKETKARTVRPFSVQFKDAFYDIFKAVDTPMTPKQVEKIETVSLRLAATFERHVSDTVEAQLGALVRALKKEHPPAAPTPPAAKVASARNEIATKQEITEPSEFAKAVQKRQAITGSADKPSGITRYTGSARTETADIKAEGDATIKD